MENPKKETTTKPETENGEDNTGRDNEQIKSIQEVIREVLKKAESDFNDLEKLTDEIRAELTKRRIKIPDDINNAVNKAVEEFEGFKGGVADMEKKGKQELLEEIFGNSVGGIMTSFHDTGQVYKQYGEKIGFKKGSIINQFPIDDKEFKEKGINEAVSISPMSTEVYGEEEYTEGTIFKKKKKRRVETGRRDLNFNEIKEGGKNEKAYRFVYKTIDDEKSIYRDQIDGRAGQYMFTELYMPESVALEILKEIKSKPKFAREIVEKLVKEKMKQDQWNGDEVRAPLRPPYEKWLENKGKSKMYVQEPDVKERGLNKDWIVDVEKGKPQEDVKPKPAEQKTEAKEKQPDKINKEKIADRVENWFEETAKLIESDSSLDSMEKYFETLKDEVSKAKEKNIDLSFIPDLDERIKDFEKKISEKKEKEEKAKPKPVAPNSQPDSENLNANQTETAGKTGEEEPKTETPETEKTAEDIENEKLADKIEREVNEGNFGDETRERLNEWNSKSEDEKKEDIKNEKGRIEGELGNRIMAENANLIEQKNVKEILESRDELAELRKKLDEEVKENMDKNREISDKIKEGIDPNVDLSQLNIGEQIMAKEAVDGFLKTTKDVLSVKEIDYLLEEMNNSGDLLKTHGERKIEMEELQEIIKAIEEYKEFMEKFEKMTKEQQEEAREELGRFVRWLNWVKENKKDLFLVLVATVVIAGIAALVLTVGLPSSMSIPVYLTLENAIKAGVGLAAVGAVGFIVKKKKVQAVLKTAGTAIGLPILGAAFIADSILNSKKMDEWMEWATGTKMMFGAGSERKK